MLRGMDRNFMEGGRCPGITCQPEPDTDPEDIEGQTRDEMRDSGEVCDGEGQLRGTENAPRPAGGPERARGAECAQPELGFRKKWHPYPFTIRVRVGSPQEARVGRRDAAHRIEHCAARKQGLPSWLLLSTQTFPIVAQDFPSSYPR